MKMEATNKTTDKNVLESEAVKIHDIHKQYAIVLDELGVQKESIETAEEIFTNVPEVLETLNNPTITRTAKDKIIDRLFPKDIRNFLKITSRHERLDDITHILEAYRLLQSQKNQVVYATLCYVLPPDDAQRDKIKAFVRKESGAHEVILVEKQDESILGGFVLSIGSMSYDWSIKGRLTRLEQKITRR